MTEDQISMGLTTESPISHEPFEPVGPPSSIESVIAEVDGSLWKLNHYYDAGDGVDGGDEEEWELHDLSADPEERTDRSAECGATLERLRHVLGEQRAAKRLTPVPRRMPG